MSSHSRSPHHSLYRHLVFILFFPSFVFCINDGIIQNRGQSSDASLFGRSVPNANDIVSFDDMPSCGRAACVPFKPESIGCPEGGSPTRDCFCGSSKAIDCAWYPCSSTEYVLVQKWYALTCTGFGYDQLSAVPSCAQGCLLSASVYSSCALKSWDCFCTANLPAACLATCSSDDTASVTSWRDAQCAKVQPNAQPRGSKTTTISAKISVYTSAGSVVTTTVAPAVTTVVNGNTNSNTINVSTGMARGLFSELTMYVLYSMTSWLGLTTDNATVLGLSLGWLGSIFSP